MIFFTADTHFGHANIIRHCERPFGSVEEMDETVLLNINARVKARDTLYHLGDFAFRRRNVRKLDAVGGKLLADEAKLRLRRADVEVVIAGRYAVG